MVSRMKKTIGPGIPTPVFQAGPLLIEFPVQRCFWADYDSEADVISFQRPQKATDSEMTGMGTRRGAVRLRALFLVGGQS